MTRKQMLDAIKRCVDVGICNGCPYYEYSPGCVGRLIRDLGKELERTMNAEDSVQ